MSKKFRRPSGGTFFTNSSFRRCFCSFRGAAGEKKSGFMPYKLDFLCFFDDFGRDFLKSQCKFFSDAQFFFTFDPAQRKKTYFFLRLM